MPTVSNHDVLGPMPWGSVGNARHFGVRDRDRSDARGGINSLLFGEASANGSSCTQEHAYAQTGAAAGAPGSFVSQNGYYGFHQQHPVAAAGGEGQQDCSMDTSENNLPDHAFGQHPSGLGCASASTSGFGGPLGPAPQHVWHADPFNGNQNQIPIPMQTRKRHFEARGCGGGPAGGVLRQGQGLPAADEDLLERAVKRTRSCPFDENHAGASTQAMAQGFEMPSSTPSIAEQSHSPAQMYDLPVQHLPRSTSQLADAMTPRPRCLMGHFI